MTIRSDIFDDIDKKKYYIVKARFTHQWCVFYPGGLRPYLFNTFSEATDYVREQLSTKEFDSPLGCMEYWCSPI